MTKVLYRPIRSGLDEAMREVKEFDSLKDMFEYIINNSTCYSKNLLDYYVSYYCYDERIDWETYIVTTIFMDGKNVCQQYGCPGAIGYCTFKEVEG